VRNRFSTINVVFNLLGSLLVILGFVLLLPIIVVMVSGELHRGTSTLAAFCISSLAAFTSGIILRAVFKTGPLSLVQSMLVCTLGWIGFSALGALPFILIIRTSFLNGFFEAMSGFTTTGITMFTGLDSLPKSLLFWRSLTQWVGGLGILTFFLAVTYRGGGAHMLFGAESHKIGMERPVPGLANTLKILWGIYSGFTLLIIGALCISGVSLFDSVCHSFTALSTGGFSPYDASIGYYATTGYAYYRWIEYILIIGMFLGGTNFLIHYRIVHRDWKALFDTQEMRFWWILIVIFTGLIFIERSLQVEPLRWQPLTAHFWYAIEAHVRGVLFQVIAIITTTGFATQDISSAFFGHLARQLFLIMMVIGGCVGSTSGGLKVLRIGILVQVIKREILRILRPRQAISRVIIDGEIIDTNEIMRVSGLFFAWFLFLIVGGGVTAFFSDLGAYESFSGMFSALGNIGPCYISVPAMGQLNPIIKAVYILGMLAGRLEILPILLLFSRRAWRG
jgi:trk system potassium uptake protein TrkH